MTECSLTASPKDILVLLISTLRLTRPRYDVRDDAANKLSKVPY